MALQVLPSSVSPLALLVDDYLMHCEARGLSPRTLDGTYSYSLRGIFLPWCDERDITELAQLDRRTFDRFTTDLLHRQRRDGKPISRFTVATYIRPVRMLVNWAL